MKKMYLSLMVRCIAAAILLGALTSNLHAEEPTIVIDYIPQLTKGGIAEGQVRWSGLTASNAGEYAVIAMLRSSWGEDYVKPLYENYLTAVDEGGYFYVNITTGGAGDMAIDNVSFFFVRRSTFAGVAGNSVQYGSMAGKYLGEPLTISREIFWQTRLLPPMPSVNSGFVASGQTITLSAADGAVIRYTLDGSDPQTSATAQNYSGSTSFRTPAAGSLLVKAYAQLAEKVSTTSSMLWLPKETLYWGTPSNFNRPLFGLCVSLALNGEQYGLKITEEETVRRMSPVKDLAHWVRTYGTVNNGHEYINKIAKQNDMKVMQGIYISENPTHVATQMEGLRQILEMGPDVPDLISIGNELSLNQKVSTATFLGAIEQVRALLKSKSLVIPVGSVDIAGATLRHAIIDRLDFIGVDIYAGTWDNTPESQMVDVTKKMYADEVASYEPKLVLITEVGTPYSGGNYVPTGASATQTPSETKARNYLDAMITWSHSDGIPLMWFAAYDEKIKSVEGHKIEEFFGLMDGNLQVHPFFKPPLSNSVVASPEKTVLQVRPNPVKESFSVETPEGTKVTVFDMTGKLVLEQNYNGVSVNLSALADGAYIVNVGKSSCKIIKRK